MADRRWLLTCSLILGAAILVGCSESDDKGHVTLAPLPAPSSAIDPRTNIEVVDNGFESDDPSGQSSSGGTGGGADAGTSAGSSSSSGSAPTSSNGGDDAARTVQEADIVQLDGTLLYALSQYGGLAIVDVSDPNHLRLLGRKRTDGMPFEMYVQNGHAYVMLNNFGRWVGDDYSGQWVETSELLSLDVSNPANIVEESHFDVPGEISDSRVVGNALYLVTFENGYCWNCGQLPATIVTSFGVNAPALSKVDQLKFEAPSQSYYWWRRSVSASSDRLYLGGPSWAWDGYSDTNRSSIVQVVDISDPAGHLKRGADVPVAGQINNRWQMDEYEGVLRVVSQYGNGWWGPDNTVDPVVQTFTVTSASQITALGSAKLTLPSPESLQSVRFDGPRGYAITAQQTDPLYTIDLSNPAAPKQAATLQMPGSIFHMEPRGDRLVGFGYDTTSFQNQKLAVSLFDVADLTKPAMLSRVTFGSGWASIGGEDADRIQKAIRVLDDDQTILVPFASYGTWDGNSCSQPQSGIQIVDYSKSALTVRGLAPHHGQPRRAMLLPNSHLLGMSDRSVSTFDIRQRDVPAKTNEVDLSNPAYRMVELPNHIASITNDWWTGEVMLSLTPKANADDANAVGKLSLANLAPSTQGYCGNSNTWASWYDARLFADGNTVWVTVPVYSYDYSNNYGTSSGTVIVASIDTSNPAAPRLVGRTAIPLQTITYGGYGYYGYGGCGIVYDGYAYYSYGGYYGSVIGSGDSFVKVGSKLGYLEVLTKLVDEDGEEIDRSTYYWNDPRPTHLEYFRTLHVVDLSNPTALVHEKPIDLPDSLGTTPLLVDNGVVMTSRWVPGSAPGKVRFFVDRVNLAGPTTPLASINVPGSLLLADAPSNRLVTTDYTVTRTPAQDWNTCYSSGSYDGYFDYETSSCVQIHRTFKLSDLASNNRVSLRQTFDPPSQHIGGVQVTDDRLYVTHYAVYDYSNYDYTKPPVVKEQGGLWAIGGIRAGSLSIVSQLNRDAQWPLAASGTKVAVYTDNGLAIYDTSTPAPALVTQATLRGYGYTTDVLLSSDHAYTSLGEWGLQTVKW